MNDDLTPMDYVRAVAVAIVLAPVLYGLLVWWLGMAPR